MNDTFKRIIVLCLVFATAFVSVHVYRAWRGGYPIFGLKQETERGQFAPEHATLQTQSAVDPSLVPGLIRANDEMIELVDRVTPAVVSIDTEILKRERILDPLQGRIYERDRVTPGLGSGVIVSEEGHVITNHHVIEGHKRIRVTLHDGRSLPATLINSDKLLDIAVLRIQGSQPDEKFAALKFGDSDAVRVGQLAIAVGNPFGLGESVTVGRVSARDRSLSDGQRDLFQTDAAINPGNSGGPLLNHLGEIIAINASIYSEDRENPGFQGIGFSIPSNDVRRTMEYILKKGRPVHGYLGLDTRGLNNYGRSVFNYSGQGVVVVDVAPGSPAEEAGLEPYDIITAYQGEGVQTPSGFINRVKRSEVGSEVILSIWRVNRSLNLTAKVSEANPFGKPESLAESGRLASDEAILKTIGLSVRPLPFNSRVHGGVLVSKVITGSLGHKKGFQPNDLILEINGARVRNDQDFYLRLVATAAVNQTKIRVIRGNQTWIVTFPPIPRIKTPAEEDPPQIPTD
jgi:serine protease Do